MTEFSSIDLTGKAPAGICPECAASALHHEPTSTDLAYCEHALVGAFRVLDRPWKIVRGVERHVFKEAMLRGIVMGELRRDIARSRHALSAPEDKPN
jgi:hypothetical protein